MNGESVDHLLLHCEVARALWNAIFSCFSLSWVMPLRVVDLFACWWTGGRPRSAAVWKMVPCFLCGACGGNAMIGSLRTKKEPLRISFPFSFILCTLGRLRSSHLYRLVLMISLYCFLFPLRCLSCILHVYLIALCAFFDISLTYPKKKNVVVMEALSRMMSTTVDRGLLSEFLVGLRNNDKLLMSHLLFADDPLFFVRQTMNSSVICVVSLYVLKWFRG
jgi:hypothetical protein